MAALRPPNICSTGAAPTSAATTTHISGAARLTQPLGDKCERAIDHLVDFGFVPQNAIDVELCLRITNGTTSFAHLIRNGNESHKS